MMTLDLMRLRARIASLPLVVVLLAAPLVSSEALAAQTRHASGAEKKAADASTSKTKAHRSARSRAKRSSSLGTCSRVKPVAPSAKKTAAPTKAQPTNHHPRSAPRRREASSKTSETTPKDVPTGSEARIILIELDPEPAPASAKSTRQ